MLKEYVTDHLTWGKSNPKPKSCGKLTCGPCNLCGNNQHNRWAHKCAIKSVSLLEVMSEFCPNLQPNHCFCNTCKRQLEEKVKNPTRELTFLKESQPQENCADLCFLSRFGSCKDVARTHTSMYTLENMENTFNIKIECDLPVPLPLCNAHHMRIYNRCVVLSCAACNVVLRSTEKKYSCASFVEDLSVCSTRLLAVNVDASLKDSDFLCLSCKMVATKVDTVQANLNQIQEDLSKPLSQPSVVRSALNFVMQKLCEICQNRDGVLLIDLYDIYIEKLQEFSLNHTDGNVDWEIYKYNSRWLWSNIYFTFGNIIEKCGSPIKRQSQMLFYRKATNTDLQSALHAALAKLRTLEQHIKNSKVEDEVRNNVDREPNSNIMLQCIVPVLNQKLRTQAMRITDKYVPDPDKVISFNYNEMLKDIDPVIWNTIAVLTMTVNERKYFESVNVLWETEHVMFPSKGLYAQQRFHRRINACLILQFAMNEDFNYPLHIIHANCIKHLSHSSKLLRLFNQAGLCVSENVLQAFLDRAKSCSKSKDLSLKPFTIVSVDNLDVLSPYAAVSTAADRSWHGTSVLAQQPLPSTELWNPIGEYLYDPINKFKKIKVYGDGRCFYRSVASYLYLPLLNCERNIVGFPVTSSAVEICGSQVNLFEFEKILADAIQVKSCEILSEHVCLLNALPPWVKESLLEEQSGNFFANFTDRIKKKRNPSAYAGRLEMGATSFLLQREIRVYQCVGGKLELTTKFPPVAVAMKNHICLLYHADERDSPGHFDLLYCSSCRLPGETNLVEVSDTGNVLFPKAAALISIAALFDPNEQQSSVDVDNSAHSSDANSLSILSTHSVPTHCSASPVAKRPKKPSFSKSTKPDIPNVEKPAKLGTPNSAFKTYVKDQVTLDRFEISVEEEGVAKRFEAQLFLYVLERYTSVSNLASIKIPGLKCKLALENPTHCEASNFKYMCVLDEKADRPETIESVCADMYNKFKINDEINHLIVAGDAATYEIINRVKAANGGFYDWVIPYLGDWHILKNAQEVLMKLFWDAGVKYIPKTTPMQTTLKNLKSCSNFKKTHRFLLQIYESMFMYQLRTFFEFKQMSDSSYNPDDAILSVIVDVVNSLTRSEGCFDVDEFLDKQAKVMGRVDKFRCDFNTFCEEMSSKFETFRFWDRFLREDCFGYIELWIALRSRNWNMRVHALKLLTPLFRACDRQNYSKLIPTHLAQMMALPNYTLEHFEKGGFASNINGVNFSSIGIDEAHECTINKDCKMSLSKSLPQNMNQIAETVQYAAQLVHVYVNQLGAARKQYLQRDFAPSVIECEIKNIQVYFKRFCESHIFDLSQEASLFQAFTMIPATLPVQKDMLTYREVGKLSIDLYVKFALVRDGSIAKLPIRKLLLHTFAPDKVTKRKTNYIVKEAKLITLCYKRTIMLSNELNRPVKELCQFLETPRAICTSNGLPYHGQKSSVYNIFEKRYKSTSCPVLESFHFPQNETCLIAEGMNIIHTKPLGFFKFFSDYAHHIVAKWVGPYLTKFKYRDVRILFDMPSGQLTPKCIEQDRRDKGSVDDMVYDSISDSTKLPLPSKWAEFLGIRENKRKLCTYLSHKFLELVPALLSPQQQFVTSGGFLHGSLKEQGWIGAVITMQGRMPHLVRHNHEETDTQIWLHVKDTECQYIHVYSIDRDIGLIGLPLMTRFADKIVLIQYSKIYDITKYLHLNMLKKAVEDDGDLGYLANPHDICKIIQTLFIASGCDFVSYFVRLGKRKFYDVLFQYAGFISGDTIDLPGQLSYTDVTSDTFHHGLLSFYRLIACVYFQANRACLNQYNSPIDIMKTISSQDVFEAHRQLLDIIRKATWKGVYEDQLLPTDEALRFHWLRSCWVSTLWGNSLHEQLTVPNIRDYGWAVSDSNTVSFIWDSESNIQAIRNNVKYLTRGCGCPKSGCVNKQCSCKKNDRTCGPGCKCPKSGDFKCQNCPQPNDSRPIEEVVHNAATPDNVIVQNNATNSEIRQELSCDTVNSESDNEEVFECDIDACSDSEGDTCSEEESCESDFEQLYWDEVEGSDDDIV